MIADLLRLASIGQNMELYASLQLRRPHNQNLNNHPENPHHHHHIDMQQQQQQPQSLVNHQRKSHHHHTKHPKNYATIQQKTNQSLMNCRTQQTVAQCGPLDLSLRGGQISLCSPPRKQESEHLLLEAHNLPLSLNLCMSHQESQKQHQETKSTIKRQRSCSRAKAAATKFVTVNSCNQLKLISSSTSPSGAESCSPSASNSICSLEDNNLSSIQQVVLGQQLKGCSEAISSTNQLKNQQQANSNTNSNTNSNNSSSNRRQKHKGLKSHLCHQCGRSFSRSDMLTRHSRLHSGLKPYQCNKCKQVFSRSDHLSTHERTHTGEKPYQCEYCAYSACRRDMITRHMRTHSNLPFQAKEFKKSPVVSNSNSSSSSSSNSNSISISLIEDKQTIKEVGMESPGSRGHLNQCQDEISTSSLEEEEEEEDEDMYVMEEAVS